MTPVKNSLWPRALIRSGLLLIAGVFWVTMNVLLWRAEYAHNPGAASSVPPSVIWHKILTAPDLSSLTILRQGKKIGSCRWSTSVAQELLNLKEESVPAPQALARRLTGFRLLLEGALNETNKPAAIRYEATLVLSSNQVWRDFKLSVNARPVLFEIRARAADQSVHISWDDGGGRLERVMSLSELGNPAFVLDQVLGLKSGKLRGRDLLVAMSQGSPPAAPASGMPFGNATLNWVGSNDELKLGHSRVQVYRLRAHLLDHYDLKVFVSRVGEILRVDLPGEIVLLNEQFAPPS